MPGNFEFSPERHELAAALGEVAPVFEDLYRDLLSHLARMPRRLADLAQAGHCVREIINALPDALGDVDRLPKFAETDGPMDRLVRAWEGSREVGPVEVPIETAPLEDDQERVITVPSAVLEAARQVAAARRTGARNGTLRRGALVLGRLDGSDPAVRVFKVSADFFMDWTHLPRPLPTDLPSEELVASHWQVVEDVLRARLLSFFSMADEITAILSQANARAVDA